MCCVVIVNGVIVFACLAVVDDEQAAELSVVLLSAASPVPDVPFLVALFVPRLVLELPLVVVAVVEVILPVAVLSDLIS